jgi:indolepyruvate ferredoxin oxidoreductase alpha subunit
MIVLDNSATAMTGFQPHPGSSFDAMGAEAPPVAIEELCASIGIQPVREDPFRVEEAAETIYDLLQQTGTKVLILRQECALVRTRKERRTQRVRVDQDRCVGEECGCNRLCTRVFRCPGLIWDRSERKARVDEAICVACGVCEQICPARAIMNEGI